jgi:hypothetical protein
MSCKLEADIVCSYEVISLKKKVRPSRPAIIIIIIIIIQKERFC